MKITTYHLEYHGIDHAQYYPGNSTVFTSWDYVFTGAGDTPFNAGEDAIDMLAQSMDVENLDVIKNKLSKRIDSRLLHMEDCPRSKRHNAVCDCESELHCYAALWIKTDESDEDESYAFETERHY